MARMEWRLTKGKNYFSLESKSVHVLENYDQKFETILSIYSNPFGKFRDSTAQNAKAPSCHAPPKLSQKCYSILRYVCT
jgi:hypothetical protein